MFADLHTGALLVLSAPSLCLSNSSVSSHWSEIITQVIPAVMGILGVLLGGYATFHYQLKQSKLEKARVAAAAFRKLYYDMMPRPTCVQDYGEARVNVAFSFGRIYASIIRYNAEYLGDIPTKFQKKFIEIEKLLAVAAREFLGIDDPIFTWRGGAIDPNREPDEASLDKADEIVSFFDEMLKASYRSFQ